MKQITLMVGLSTLLAQLYSGSCDCNQDQNLKSLFRPGHKPRRPQGRISDGHSVAPFQFPFYAYLMVNGSGDDNTGWECGGAILNKLWTVTAAKCILRASGIALLFGGNTQNNMRVKIRAKKWFAHELYDNCTDDIGLVKLKRSLRYSNYIQSISITKKLEETMKLATMGLGRTGEGPYNDDSDILLYVHVKTVDFEHCTSYWGSDLNNVSIICSAGYTWMSDSPCDGDFGGPLVVDYDGEYMLSGIVSLVSKEGCNLGYPVGYTKVWHYVNWIGDIMKKF